MSTRRASSVATAHHRRFSTASHQPPDEETMHLRQKLALLRGRVQQQQQQQTSSPASSSPQSSSPPSSLSRKRTNRRSSIAALTASARAKQVNRTTNPEDHPIKKSTGDTNDSKRPSAKKLSTKLPRLSPVSNEPEPNHHRAATTTNTAATATTTTTTTQRLMNRPRSTSVRTDVVRVRRTKECCKSPTTSGDEKLADLNRRLLAALLDEDKAPPPPPIDRVTLFPEDDDDDLLSTKSKTRARRQRRQSMPAVKDVKNNTYVDENSSQKPNPGFWKELVDIKSRLQKLEVNGHVDDNGSNSSSTTTTTTAPSVFDHPASIHTPSSPLSNAASSTSSSPRTSVHQKRLQDAYAIFEQKHQLPLYPRPNPLLKSMSAVIAETIAINQKLWAAIPQDLNTDARSLVAMQKSSDNQLRELTEALYLMGGEQEQPVDPIVLPRQYRRQSQVFTEDVAYIPPSSRPASHYYSPEQPRSRPVSYYHTSGPTFHQHMVKPLQQTPALSVDHSPRSSSIRPLKVAGILDYPSDHLYYHNRPTSKYYDHHRYASGSLYDD
ncbi:hypothetical protein BJV82DRAFT_667811 [Fennellomyces sp. T-0311]|nr:hypothetical protein BJV82DRAFT_667811 [Fennellomyces sp. T-0311]